MVAMKLRKYIYVLFSSKMIYFRFSNAVAPLVAIWLTYKEGCALNDTSTNPMVEYIILFGAAGMIVGLWLLGHKVIKTIGTKIVTVTPPRYTISLFVIISSNELYYF